MDFVQRKRSPPPSVMGVKLPRRRLFSHGTEVGISSNLNFSFDISKGCTCIKYHPSRPTFKALSAFNLYRNKEELKHTFVALSAFIRAFCPTFKLFRERVKWSQFTDEFVRFSQFSVHLSWRKKRTKRTKKRSIGF